MNVGPDGLTMSKKPIAMCGSGTLVFLSSWQGKVLARCCAWLRRRKLLIAKLQQDFCCIPPHVRFWTQNSKYGP